MMLRARIVYGINNNGIQKWLLTKQELDYVKAVETAMNTETVAQSVRELKSRPEGQSSNSPVPLQMHGMSVTFSPE